MPRTFGPARRGEIGDREIKESHSGSRPKCGALAHDRAATVFLGRAEPCGWVLARILRIDEKDSMVVRRLPITVGSFINFCGRRRRSSSCEPAEIVASSEDAEVAESSQELNEHTYEIRNKTAQSKRRSDIPGAAAVTVANPLPASVAGFFFQR